MDQRLGQGVRERRGGERDRGQGVPPLPPGQDNRQVLQAEGPAEGRARQAVTGIGENTLAQPVKPPLRERRICLAKLVKNRLTPAESSKLVLPIHEPRGKTQVEGAASAPLDWIIDAAGRRGHVRAGREKTGARYLSKTRMNKLYDEGTPARTTGQSAGHSRGPRQGR